MSSQSTTPIPDKWNTADWPLQLQHHAGGWTVAYYDGAGHALHVANTETETAAFRVARDVARLYGFRGKVLVRSSRGDYGLDLDRIMH